MKHLKENNETYCSHFLFAIKIAIHLVLTAFFLIVHGIFPFLNQPKTFCLDATCKKIQRWNEYSKRRKNK